MQLYYGNCRQTFVLSLLVIKLHFHNFITITATITNLPTSLISNICICMYTHIHYVYIHFRIFLCLLCLFVSVYLCLELSMVMLIMISHILLQCFVAASCSCEWNVDDYLCAHHITWTSGQNTPLPMVPIQHRHSLYTL